MTGWFGVVLDAPDARALAAFYSKLLGWEVFTDTPEWVDLAPSRQSGYNLAFATEPNYRPPVWPSNPYDQQMQIHLDFEVDDLNEGVAHALSCGAQLARYQPQVYVRVFVDPVGHLFCLYCPPPPTGAHEHAPPYPG